MSKKEIKLMCQECIFYGNALKKRDKQISNLKDDLHQIYSHLGVEAYGEDIHEQALREIAQLKQDVEMLALSNSGLARMVTKKDHQIKELEKALELAVETMRYELGRAAIKNLYKDAMKNLKDNLNMKFDTEMCDWYKEQAKEMMKSE